MNKRTSKKRSNDDLDYIDIIRIVAQLPDKPDRETAIVCASAIENYLSKLLRRGMIEMSPSDTKEVFGFNRPLGSFSSKIIMCCAFGYIDMKFKKELDTIREIRNEFSHCTSYLSFTDSYISKKCLELHVALETLGFDNLQLTDPRFSLLYNGSNPGYIEKEDGSFEAAIRFPNLYLPRGRFVGTVNALTVIMAAKFHQEQKRMHSGSETEGAIR